MAMWLYLNLNSSDTVSSIFNSATLLLIWHSSCPLYYACIWVDWPVWLQTITIKYLCKHGFNQIKEILQSHSYDSYMVNCNRSDQKSHRLFTAFRIPLIYLWDYAGEATIIRCLCIIAKHLNVCMLLFTSGIAMPFWIYPAGCLLFKWCCLSLSPHI